MRLTGTRGLFLVLFFLQIILCAKTDDIDPATFKIYFLKQDIHDLGLGYDYGELWNILRNVDLTDNHMVISGDDIQVYDWASQTISLTQEASSTYNSIPVMPYNRDFGFVVTFHDERLYGGCLIDSLTARGLDFPVITNFHKHIYSNAEPSVVLEIRPDNYYFKRYEELDPTLKRRIEFPEVHDFFKKLGKLRE